VNLFQLYKVAVVVIQGNNIVYIGGPGYQKKGLFFRYKVRFKTEFKPDMFILTARPRHQRRDTYRDHPDESERVKKAMCLLW